MKIISKIISGIALFSLVAILACSGEDKDIIILRATGNGATFSGFYNFNAGASTALVPVQIFSSLYEAEVHFRDLDFLEVSVTKAASASTITIKIYRDDIKIKEASIDSNELVSGSAVDFKLTQTLDYQYGEEETTTTTTTTTKDQD